ncbi:MinD/ParA family protein [Desulfohalovibrio reitneri]|uniref:MinD/ParA family protein n=1 Tax=Desulfohalovibrio reitneri TaxID=1307759 RepID=UPI000550C715|nr:MinD/ParA family protein [Desulfohalovibrio reitneri]
MSTHGSGRARVVSIASGKGGVGKTSLAVNLARSLAEAGKRTCLLDADLGLANVDILLGLEPKYTLEDVLFNGLPMERALVQVRERLHVLSGSSGVQRMAVLDRASRARLAGELGKLDGFDYLVVDNSPGITPQIISLCLASQDVVAVTTPDAASVTDAYALLKVLRNNGQVRRPLLLVNRARTLRQATRVHQRMDQTAASHLGLGCSLLGVVPDDADVSRAAAMRTPVLDMAPAAPASRMIKRAAERLLEAGGARSRPGRSPGDFFQDLMVRMQGLADAFGPGKDPRLERVAGKLDELLRRKMDRDLRLGLEELRRILGNGSAPGRGGAERTARDNGSGKAVKKAAPAKDAGTGASPEATPGTGKPVPSPGAKKPSVVLLCCPDPPMLELLEEVVAELGLTAEARPVEELLRGGVKPGPEVAVVCWDGPEADKTRLLRALKDMPVILLEGLRTRPCADPAYLSLASAVLHRPFRLEQLRSLVAEHAASA